MIYDLIIIGSGPAGLTASIYAARYRLKHLVIGKELGGAMSLASAIENYPGFKRISGVALTKRMVDQTESLGGKIIKDSVVKLVKQEINQSSVFTVITGRGKKYQGRTIIFATGTRRRELGVPGEREYLGRGVSYCATCDAPLFRQKKVAVIGGANAAVMSAVHLAKFAQKVYLIYRGTALRAEPIWNERALNNPKVEVIYERNLKQILGDNQKVNGVILDFPYEGKEKLEVEGVFIEIGGVPGTELARQLGVALDENHFIKVGPDMATNITGVFAAGDVANAAGELQQVVTACSEGAIAATSVYRFLKK